MKTAVALAGLIFLSGCGSPSSGQPSQTKELSGTKHATVAQKPAQEQEKHAPAPRAMIFVEAVYPGANARTVADTVAAPIEQQINGIENLLHLTSRSTHDGKYLLALTFAPGTDLARAQMLVKERLTLAMPTLPEAVKQAGPTLTKKTPVCLIVNLSSPENRYDTLYLGNYATLQIKDELARVVGVAAISIFGHCDLRVHLWLDPERLAAYNLTFVEVEKALREQNVQGTAGRIGQPPGKAFELQLSTLGRLTDIEEFGNIMIKTEANGLMIRLKDVGRLELGAASPDSVVSYNGKPSVALAVYATGDTPLEDLSRAVADRLNELRPRLPEGLRLDIAFDGIAPHQPTTYLLLDLELPAGISMERIQDVLRRCETLLRQNPDVRDILSMTENPFDLLRSQPCFLVRLVPTDPGKGREEIQRALRSQFEQIPEAAFRLRDLGSPNAAFSYGYPIELAIQGPEANEVSALAQKLGERLSQNPKLTDVGVSPDSRPQAQLHIDIDRTQAAAHGVNVADISKTLEIHFGSIFMNDFNRFGRTWQLVLKSEERFRSDIEGIKRLQVRNAQGAMVPLGALATVQLVSEPLAIHRLDLSPMVGLRANPAAGISLDQARTLCESHFAEVRKEMNLPDTYRLVSIP